MEARILEWMSGVCYELHMKSILEVDERYQGVRVAGRGRGIGGG